MPYKAPEKKRKACREWRERNSDHVREYRRAPETLERERERRARMKAENPSAYAEYLARHAAESRAYRADWSPERRDEERRKSAERMRAARARKKARKEPE